MFNSRLQKIILFIFAIIFFIVTSWFIVTVPNIYNSPDETANAFFINRLALQGDFLVFDPLNNFLNNILHPRSVSFNGISLVSQGFLGLSLIYGYLAKIIGLNFINLLTPFLAVLAIFAFYGIIKKIWDSKIAFISAILLSSFPIFLYYSARALYPNVPFISSLLISVWAVVSGALNKKGRVRYLIIFSCFLGVALMVRPIEILWIASLAILLIFFYRKNIDLKRVFYSLLIMGFLALPVLYNNIVLYGGIFSTGYTLDSSIGQVQELNVGISNNIAGHSLLLYGFHPRVILNNFLNILIKYFWWYTIPAVFGFFFWLKNKKEKNQVIYLISFFIISFWLLFFYGSGIFTDNPNINRLTIGDSHFRYWLPIFILMIPFIAIFIRYLVGYFSLLIYKKIVLISFILFIFMLSFYSVFYSLDDGLLNVKNNLIDNFKARKEVLDFVNRNDIIITGRQDKIFFPYIRVLYTEDIKSNLLLDNISRFRGINFYYYAIGINSDNLNIINQKLLLYNFKLNRVLIVGKEALYKLVKLNEKSI